MRKSGFQSKKSVKEKNPTYVLNLFILFIFSEGEKAGLKPDDYQASVATLHSISSSLGLECVLLRERTAQEGTVAEYLLRQKLEPHDFMEVR